MARKTLWQWSDGATVHKGYTTKKAAMADAQVALDIARVTLGAHATHSFKVSSYLEQHTAHGIVSKFSQPSNGADSLFNTYQSIRNRELLNSHAREKKTFRDLAVKYLCDSCGELIDTIILYEGNNDELYYGCPDTTCCEEVDMTKVRCKR